jgi:hypothetical protein
VAIENKQAGPRHGGSQFVPCSPIRFLFEIDRQTLMQANAALSPWRWFFQQLCAMAPACMMLSQTKMHANSVLCIFTIKGKWRISRRNLEIELVAEPLAKTVSPAPSRPCPRMRAGASDPMSNEQGADALME